MAEVLAIRPRADARSHDPPPDPPSTLSEEAAEIWSSIVEEWILGSDALPLLVLGLESWDRYREAANVLHTEGPVVVNEQSGAVKQHPCHAIARDNATQFRQCFRQLHLEPPEAV